MITAAESSGIDVGRIVEIAEAIAPEVSVFDASLGIDDKCLSAEKLVQLLHQGVHGEDAAYVMRCSSCAENVRHLQSVSLKSSRDFVGNALKKTVWEKAAPFKGEFVPAILAIPETMIGIGNILREKGMKRLLGQARIEFVNRAESSEWLIRVISSCFSRSNREGPVLKS